jgi:hypothetical protein
MANLFLGSDSGSCHGRRTSCGEEEAGSFEGEEEAYLGQAVIGQACTTTFPFTMYYLTVAVFSAISTSCLLSMHVAGAYGGCHLSISEVYADASREAVTYSQRFQNDMTSYGGINTHEILHRAAGSPHDVSYRSCTRR